MIYFAQPRNGGPIRIGCSNNFDVRRRTLGTWVPGGIEVLLEMEGTFLGEGVLHQCFNPIRVDRDWFASCPAMWKFLLSSMRERPSWVPMPGDAAPALDIPAVREEFGGRENCFKLLGYKTAIGFEQAMRSTSRDSFSIASRIIFHRLLRDGALPDFIAELHRPSVMETAA